MKHFYSLPFYSTSLYSERNKNSRINVKPLRMCVSKNAAFSECATRTHSAMEETPSSTSLASYVFHPPLSLYLPLPRLLFSYSCSSLARSLSCSFLSFLSSLLFLSWSPFPSSSPFSSLSFLPTLRPPSPPPFYSFSTSSPFSYHVFPSTPLFFLSSPAPFVSFLTTSYANALRQELSLLQIFRSPF